MFHLFIDYDTKSIQTSGLSMRGGLNRDPKK